MRKTYLRYPGGKSKSLKNFIHLVPEFEEFREPFVGGGSVFLFLKNKYPDKKFWINDKYKNLYLFWLMARDYNDELVSRLLEIKKNTTKETSSEVFKSFRNDINGMDVLNRAVYFYYLNKCSFSGLTESGTCSPQAWVQNFSESSIESLRDLKEILRGVRITNLDYSEVLREPGERVFLYLDPPYDIGEANSLYGRDGKMHKEFDHVRFYEDVKETLHKFLISYNDSEILRERFKKFTTDTLEFRYTMRQSKTGGECFTKVKTELLVRNYA